MANISEKILSTSGLNTLISKIKEADNGKADLNVIGALSSGEEQRLVLKFYEPTGDGVAFKSPGNYYNVTSKKVEIWDMPKISLTSLDVEGNIGIDDGGQLEQRSIKQLEETPSKNVIYCNSEDNKLYIWNGTDMIEVSDDIIDGVIVTQDIFNKNNAIFETPNTKYNIVEPIVFTSDVTVGKKSTLCFFQGAYLEAQPNDDSLSLIINNVEIQSPLQYIFKGFKILGVFNNESIPVEWFGAVGDGVTDDAPAINKAIKYGWVSEILLSAQHYYVDSSIIFDEKDTSKNDTRHKLEDEGVKGLGSITVLDSGTEICRGFKFKVKGYIHGGPNIPNVVLDSSTKQPAINGGVLCINCDFGNFVVDGGIITDITSTAPAVFMRGYHYNRIYIKNLFQGGLYNGALVEKDLIGDGFYMCNGFNNFIHIDNIDGFNRGFVISDEFVASGSKLGNYGNEFNFKSIDCNHEIYWNIHVTDSYITANTVNYTGCGRVSARLAQFPKISEDSTFLSLIGTAGRHRIYTNKFTFQYVQTLNWMLFNFANLGDNKIYVDSCIFSDTCVPLRFTYNTSKTATMRMLSAFLQYKSGDSRYETSIYSQNNPFATYVKMSPVNIVNSHDVQIHCTHPYDLPSWCVSSYNVQNIIIDATSQYSYFNDISDNAVNAINYVVNESLHYAKSYRINSVNYSSTVGANQTAYPYFSFSEKYIPKIKLLNNAEWTTKKETNISEGLYVNSTFKNGAYPLFITDSASTNTTAKWCLNDGTEIYIDDNYGLFTSLTSSSANVKETDVQLGGTAVCNNNTYSILDFALNPIYNSNKFTFARPEGIGIYTSTTNNVEPLKDPAYYHTVMTESIKIRNGQTPTTSDKTNQKANIERLVSQQIGDNSAIGIGGSSSNNNIVMITLDADMMGRQSNALGTEEVYPIYSILTKFLLYVYKPGPSTLKIKVIGETYTGTKTEFIKEQDLIPGDGTGWVTLNTNRIIFGGLHNSDGTSSQTSHYRYLHFYIKCTEGNSGGVLYRLFGYGNSDFNTGQQQGHIGLSNAAANNSFFTVDYNGNATFPAEVSGTSDIRLKENLVQITNNTDLPNLYSFDLKNNGEHSYGFIAQELEETHPELVITDNSEEGLKSIKYWAAHSYMIAQLCNKIKELEDKIEKLTK